MQSPASSSMMDYLNMHAESETPASIAVGNVPCRACGSYGGAVAAYCSTCGSPLLDGGLSARPAGTQTLSGERLLAGYVIPGILLTFLTVLLGPIGILLLPGPIAIALALDAYGKLRQGDVEGADRSAWKARIALAIGGVVLGVRCLTPVAMRVLNFLTSL